MATIEHEIRTLHGTCPTHGHVVGIKNLPKIKFPFLITGPARGLATLRPYRCPECGAKVSG